jgi:thiol-disulfide isomerase/thioredoxin
MTVRPWAAGRPGAAATLGRVRRHRLLVPLAAAAVLAAGCDGEASTADSESAATSTERSPVEESPAADPPARNDKDSDAPLPETLDFSATTVRGEPFRGESLVGEPALLWFWAPWCPTCRSQIPQVEGIAEQYDGRLAVVGVGSLDSADAIADFAAEVSGVTHLEDSEGALYRKFGIAEQSSFVLLGEDGEVAYKVGYGGSDDLGAEVADVVG